jgi:hypothetical protein
MDNVFQLLRADSKRDNSVIMLGNKSVITFRKQQFRKILQYSFSARCFENFSGSNMSAITSREKCNPQSSSFA